MRNAILRQLQAEYEQLRADDILEEERRREEAVRRCPEIGKLLSERQQIIWRGLRGILDGKAQASDLPGRMEVLTGRIAQLLTQSGFPADYLDPVYHCAVCHDTGYVGEPVREMCTCMRSKFYARLYSQVGLSEKGEQSFESFDASVFSAALLPGQPFSQRDMMEMIREQCEAYADNYPNADTKDLLLLGQSGLGKTFLMHAMAKRLLDRGLNVLMVSAYRFLDIARRAYFQNAGEELATLMDTDVLMLDDLGSEPLMENITVAQTFNLLNERQTRGRGTVLSTNLTPSEFQKRYTERIASRLSDKRQCTTLQFLGEDVRRRL